ncbi:hypothetical protein PHACT_12675 [Pseudohongiella acticola]|uniref:Uncharacterized protein n=1 Tax=Pseudohongiella acticola TaxID=1524254 RepID=A0A1E8CGH3_9GAMM|nr:hypothetical protein [Pseudohongiella acticola]OFE11405.1 hypothetical protein PHACT_12675 [Pseudohongiella acticola]
MSEPQASEDKLDQASDLLRRHGYTVLRPDPFRDAQQAARSVSPRKQENLNTGARQKKRVVGADMEQRVVLIKQLAGKVPSVDIANRVGISMANLSNIASRYKISLRLVKGK